MRGWIEGRFDSYTSSMQMKMFTRIHSTRTMGNDMDQLIDYKFEQLKLQGMDPSEVEVVRRLYHMGYAFFPQEGSFVQYNAMLGH